MSKVIEVSRSGQTLWLSAEKCLFWEEECMLILSDWHIGKAAHFRKSGIAVPGQLYEQDIRRIDQQIEYFKPRKLLVTGDFFHSEANEEHNRFRQWRHTQKNLDCFMVRGNHEVLSDQDYFSLGIEVLGDSFFCGPFCFFHQKPSAIPEGSFAFTGHVHPGVKLKGAGKQSLILPCFYFSNNFCVLPAFSSFTGKFIVEPSSSLEIFVILNDGTDIAVCQLH